jgi:hypothetical protein
MMYGSTAMIANVARGAGHLIRAKVRSTAAKYSNAANSQYDALLPYDRADLVRI